jgi:hypothetical protein
MILKIPKSTIKEFKKNRDLEEAKNNFYSTMAKGLNVKWQKKFIILKNTQRLIKKRLTT